MSDTWFNERAWGAIRFGLFQASADFSGQDWVSELLTPWAQANGGVIETLHKLGEGRAATYGLSDEDTWTLYALSRCVELAMAPLQPAAATSDDEPFDHLLPDHAYSALITALDASRPRPSGFHPFFHEIVKVVPADDPDAEPELTHEWWPAMMAGSLLLQRAGVTVRSGRNHLDPLVAEGSALYWAWSRRNRPVVDLSHGWGSNSQWRTEFRRDYLIGDKMLFNVDALFDAEADDDEPEEKVDLQLVRHRCSIMADHGPDVWAFDTYHEESTTFTM